jgi:hypothetical protein
LVVKDKTRARNIKVLSEIILSMWMNIEAINTKEFWKTKREIKLKLSVKDYNYLLVDRFVERAKIELEDVFISCEFV